MYRGSELAADKPRTGRRQPAAKTSSPAGLSDEAFQQELQRQMPLLDALSGSMCRDRELAKDLAQDTYFRAWRGRAKFKPGTNMKAWLCTILRNVFYSHHRRAWRQVNCDNLAILETPGPEDAQEWAVVAADAFRALHAIPAEQRRALMLIGLGGLEYAEAAAISRVPEGTLKSRVSRARKSALAALEGNGPLAAPRPPIGNATNALMRELESAMRG